MACMHKTTMYLEDELYARLQRAADASGRTQASVIREAVAVYLAGGKTRRLRSIGLGSSGKGDLSERAEELLDGFGES
jgi:predicted transcriptional regulator